MNEREENSFQSVTTNHIHTQHNVGYSLYVHLAQTVPECIDTPKYLCKTEQTENTQ